MTRLPIISGADAVRAFQTAGWAIARRKGSHVILVKRSSRANLSVPQHKELDPGTLRGLIRDAGISTLEFVGYLRST